MIEIYYTDETLDEFRSLVEALESNDQMLRINARLYMPKFIEKHTKEKCDKMFEILEGEL